MSATVRIPTILRNYTGGAGEVSAEAGKLSEILDSLEGNHPGSAVGSSTTRGRFVGLSTSTSATTTCASSAAWTPR